MSDFFKGDTHNFGRSVSRVGEWVEKPRPIYWEWLFLDGESPLRTTSRELSYKKSIVDPFGHFPDLKFKYSTEEVLPYSGQVSFFQQTGDSSFPSIETSRALGSFLATILFFGMPDLHAENLMISKGRDAGSVLFFPIDIELIFAPVKLLSDTFALRCFKNESKFVGINLLKRSEVNVAEVISSFLKSMDSFHEMIPSLQDLFRSMPIEKVPIRTILKDTMDYVRYLRGESVEAVWMPAELEQLGRGDIPYFYHYLGSTEILYLSSEGPKKSTAAWEEHYGQIPELVKNKKTCISMPNEKFVKFSVAQIARNFKFENESYSCCGDVEVSRFDSLIYIDVKDRWKLKCKVI